MRSLSLSLLLALGLPTATFAQAMVQALPGSSDADLLAATMRRVAANPLDLDALVTAGEQSLKVDDLSGAASLFARAEKIDPRNGRVKAGMATILVRSERPGEALRYFGQAEAAGLDPRRFAADRGLAFDLIGEQERAQRDYRLALGSEPDDETTRRYALSLGISGRRDEALKALDPLLGRTDRAAWRARAFVLAMAGDQAEAARIASTMMPGGMAQGLLPFFQRLPALPPADRAFAVHFGEVRATPERIADARLAPSFPPLPPTARPPVQVAAAAPIAPAREDRRSRDRRGRERDGEVALAARTATLPAAAAVVAAAPIATAPVQAPTRAANRRRSKDRFTPGRTQIATAEPVVVPAAVIAALPPLGAPPTTVAARNPSPGFTPALTPGLAPLVPATAVAANAPTPAVASPAPALAATPSIKAVSPSATTLPPTVTSSPTPVSPAPVRVAEVAPALTAVSPARTVRPVTRPLPRGDADAVLARIVASLSIPAEELGVAAPPARTPPAGDAGARTQAAAQAKVARDAAIDRAAQALVADRAPAPTAAERRATAAKALADRKALAAKKEAAAKKLADDKAAAEERRVARANPSRIWVQVAGGAHEADLPKAWAATRAKAPQVFGSRGGYSARLRATNRVVTGPFKTDAEARAFVNQLAKAGVAAFPFTSDSGESVSRLPAK